MRRDEAVSISSRLVTFVSRDRLENKIRLVREKRAKNINFEENFGMKFTSYLLGLVSRLVTFVSLPALLWLRANEEERGRGGESLSRNDSFTV